MKKVEELLQDIKKIIKVINFLYLNNMMQYLQLFVVL